jgi:diadenosine tetraphosphate (Ap4A) HIT family hydrolase
MTREYERYMVDWNELHRRFQTGPCFICQIVKGNPEYPAHIVHEDEMVIAFLDKYPVLYGYTLVCPREHREQVTGDFTLTEYLALQRRIYRIAEAVRQEVNAERVYLLTLGSQEGNAHVHWHIVPLPSGIPYREQQLYVFRRDVLRIPEDERASLAARIRQRVKYLEDA